MCSGFPTDLFNEADDFCDMTLCLTRDAVRLSKVMQVLEAFQEHYGRMLQ